MERYCTKCGKIVTKENDSLYLCETGHENWINPALGAEVFVLKEGKILYGVRAQEPFRGKLDLPGGFVEINETAENAAIRETKEEMGVDVELIGVIGTYTSVYQGRPSLDIVFVARITSGEVIAGDDMKGGEPVWRALDDLPSAEDTADSWFSQAQEDLRFWLRQNPAIH